MLITDVLPATKPIASVKFPAYKSVKCNEIRKSHSNQIMIGKPTIDVDKEDYDNDADDDDVDNAEDSEGEEFE